jgi:exopolyphosphatase / guanosine-5'-triphosphate,3'-diphosphate pyrophosphatase
VNRFAAIDIGSNAMRCHVVEIAASGEPRVLESIREPVRLGSRVFLTGRIGPSRMERAVEAFLLFHRLIRSHEVTLVRAVATSAVREAADGPEFVKRVREETGIELKVIDGGEEAHLVRRAVGSRLDMSKGRAAAVDVGGGSVEILAVMDGKVLQAESFTIGALRLLEALDDDADRGASDFFSFLDEYLDAIRSRVATALGSERADLVAATGGSAETLGELIGRDAEGPAVLAPGVRTIEMVTLREFAQTLAGLSFNERIERYQLRPDRADVILPAAMIYLKVAEILGAETIFVPNVGLKDGLILDLVEELERAGALDSRRQEVRAAALGLGRRYRLDEPHALKVTELALSLFDQLEDLHGLPGEARTLLEAAALLHDIGLFISASKHHKHSQYIISESEVVGLDRAQREIVANVARYHRRRHPTEKHPPFAALSTEEQETVRKLAAILRVADVLDRDHSRHVSSVEATVKKKSLQLRVSADRNLLLERWAAQKKFLLFEEVFGRPVELKAAEGKSHG